MSTLAPEQRAVLIRVRVAEAFKLGAGKRVTPQEAKLYYALDHARVPSATFVELDRVGLIAWNAGWQLTEAGQAELEKLLAEVTA